MTTFQQLEAEWEKDSKIESSDLAEEVLRGARLHQKWLRYFNEFRLKHNEQSKIVAKMEDLRRRWYRGILSREELAENEWQPYNLPEAKTQGERDRQIEIDPEMINVRDKLFRYRMGADMCEEVIKKIRDRGFDIRTAVDYMKFASGN
jgi:hypothetical protein